MKQLNEMLVKLQEYGADVNGAMGRFLGDFDLYRNCFTVFLKDEAFEKLHEALLINNYEEAFECAHSLKGVAGNMGLTPLYNKICCIVEALRAKEYSQLNGHYEQVIKELEMLQKIDEQF